MDKPLRDQILAHLQDEKYRPKKPRQIAKAVDSADDDRYGAFRTALRELMDEGRVALGAQGTIMLPTERRGRSDEVVGTYRHNKKGFGFVIPTDVGSHEDVFVPEGNNTASAITGDVVRVRVTGRGQRDGKPSASGKIVEVIERKNKRFVGTLQKSGIDWFVLPDGNAFIEPIYCPDAATRYIKPGTIVVCEITEFPTATEAAMGVITEVLGKHGDKDVDLKTVIAQFGLPGEFPQEVKDQASAAVADYDPKEAGRGRYDLSDRIVCTIDPDDAKDYDDAISLWKTEDGLWELGVHIADVSHFVKDGTPLDVEAVQRGNSTYFPGHVIPMLPEVLSNGICSLQEGVPRLTKSAFIVFDEDAKPVRTRFSNSVIHSRKRLRYREAQAIIDREEVVPHPHGDKKVSDYDPEIVQILDDMNELSRAIQKRRQKAGQLVLNLPRMQLVLDDTGKVIDAVEEDHSFTHTLIEMFMVEANEAVARLLDGLNVAFLRRTHPEPEPKAAERLRGFLTAAGHTIPKEIDRHVLQDLLAKVKDKPESFSVNLAVLRSLTRAEYSPKVIGHFALASQHYCHFTSPIRRYADLTIHRLMDAFFEAIDADFTNGPIGRGKAKPQLRGIPNEQDFIQLGKNISYTERRSEDAERELRQVKLLELMSKHVGEQFTGVVTGITNFGLFIQIQKYLVEGLIRYPQLLNDRWEVDEKAGSVKGMKTGQRIRIGDVAKVTIEKVDVPRREMNLIVNELVTRTGQTVTTGGNNKPAKDEKPKKQYAKGQTLPSKHKDKPRQDAPPSTPNAPKKRHPLDLRNHSGGEEEHDSKRGKQRNRKKH